MAEDKAEKRDAEEKTENTADGAAKPKSNLMLIIVIGVVITVLTPVVTFFVVKATVPPPLETTDKAKPSANTVYDLGEIYVNVAETKGTRVLKFQPTLVLSEAKMPEKLEPYVALLKDRVLLAASVKTIDELDGPNGKEALKREMLTSINSAIKDKIPGAVIDVYFSQFLIQ